MKILLIIIGLIILTPMTLVAIGIPFKVGTGKFRVFTQHAVPATGVYDYDLPGWLRWLQNPEDGLTGDIRGWYWNTYFPESTPAWFKMWWWSGVRNPWNYFKRIVIGIDIREYVFELVAGDAIVRDDLVNPGFQIIKGTHKQTGFKIFMLYWVKELHKGRGIVLQIGPKIKLGHNTAAYDKEIDYFKGWTFEPNPYKDLT